MKWIKASERQPQDWSTVLVRETGHVKGISPKYKLSHKENLLVLDEIDKPSKYIPLKFVEWLNETKPDKCIYCGSNKVFIRGRYPGSPERLICPTCIQEKLEGLESSAKSPSGEQKRQRT